MLHVRWVPSFLSSPEEPDVLSALALCQSKLELMYLLGVAYYLHSNGRRWGLVDAYPEWHLGTSDDKQAGVWFSEPWWGYWDGIGPSALLLVPQWRSSSKPIHHDFGVFAGDDNGDPRWSFVGAVEIDGYGIHSDHRLQDKGRDSELPYPVWRIYEETTSPLTWFDTIVTAEQASYFSGGFLAADNDVPKW